MMKFDYQVALFLSVFFITTLLLGRYMYAVFRENQPLHFCSLSWMERLTYKIAKIDSKEEMSWQTYAKSLIYFSLCGFIFLFALLLLQGFLPLNPQNFSALEPFLAFNTVASFVTNSDWQAYAGENSMSYLSQMSGLTVQNFLCAATGNAVLLAFIRGIYRKTTKTIGNFWVDLTKTIVYLLLPLSIIFALILVSQGVIQSFSPYETIQTLEGHTQTIPFGPVASQEAIKQLGSNGGGFFNANSSHPFENPTPFSNFLQMLAIVAIPSASIYMFGLMIGSKRQANIIYLVLWTLWLGGLTLALYSQHQPNNSLDLNANLEGLETRFHINQSILWTTVATCTSNGSINSSLDSLSPLAGGVALFNMMVGEVIFGGIGVGLCSIIMYVLLTVFLAGLMVGRTPEYLGKKIEKNEMRWVMVAILIPCALILIGSTIAIIFPDSLKSLSNAGPHGLTEVIYAFTSVAANNGSAFAGLDANTVFYNLILGFTMLCCRLAIIVPSLAIAASLGEKKVMAPSLGTFATDSFLFAVLLLSIILIISALTFFPALALGPFIEQILMKRGQIF